MAQGLTPWTAAQMVTAGFTKISGMNSLYQHARYPGFVFKVVDTIQQALACGGIYLRNSQRSMFYFGLDMDNAYRLTKLGQYAIPAEVTFTPMRESRRVWERMNWNSQIIQTRMSCFLHFKTPKWTEFPDDNFFVGVISKADRGFVLDHPVAGYAAATWTIPFTDPPGIVKMDGTNIDSAGADKLVMGQHPMAVKISESVCSGYIWNSIPINKRNFYQKVKPGFIARMEAEQAVKDAHEEAFDEMIAEVSATAEAQDDFALSPTIVANVMLFRHKRKRYQMSFSPGGASSGLWMASTRSWPLNKAYPPGGSTGNYNPNVPADASLHEGAIPLIWNEQSYKGYPFPFFNVSSNVNGYASSRAFGVDIETESPDTPYRLDAVPYGKVKFFQAEAINAGSAWGAVSPAARPLDMAQTAVLDCAIDLNREFASFVNNVNSAQSVSGANVADQQASANETLGKLDKRRAEFALVFPYLRNYSRFIAETELILSAKAKAILKNDGNGPSGVPFAAVLPDETKIGTS